MPVQALIRNLTRPQVEKVIADSKQKLAIQDYHGQILIVVESKAEGGDPAANAVLQKIADADAAITHKQREERVAAAAKAKADAAASNNG
jgi:hypothetical protein